MCGIGALISPADDLSAGLVAAMQPAVTRRGPDDEGIVCFGGVDALPSAHGGPDTPAAVYSALLPYAPAPGPLPDGARVALTHRRLSILDLTAAGHQPMCTRDGACWIVHNGEIYNYLELRDELRARGHEFQSQSDTEVILAAWREWGSGCLQRFNGMFAFVLHDRSRRMLFAARDRFGVKPLYYWVSPRGIVALASEIKQFAALPGWRPRLNGQRAYDFLNWAVSDHTDETLFEGVFQLRGGEALAIDLAANAVPRPGARLPVERWYELRPAAFRGTLAEASAQFRRLLTDSVRLRLRSDVPVGSCLSGGLDSSSIVCLMNGLLREKDAHAMQRTFSAGATVPRFDEREYIEEVVRHTGVTAHYVIPRLEQVFEFNERITRQQDEPFGSTSTFAQWQVFGLAAQAGIKVMLDGQGADEHLAGYHSFFPPRFRNLLLDLRWPTLWKERRAARAQHAYRGGIRQALGGLLPEGLRQPLRRLAGRAGTTAPWLDLERLGATARDPFLEAGVSRAGSVRALSRAQILATSLPMMLHYEDRNSMAHSVEARLPFLDYRLVEFVLGLPDEHKIGGGLTKRVLREGMRGVLPERVRQRADKLGFVTPEEVWMLEQGTPLFRRELRAAVDAAGGVVKPQVLELFDGMVGGRRPFSHLFWRLISFGAWMRVFSVSG